MDTQEVDFGHFDFVLLDDGEHWDARDGGVEFALEPDPDEPVLLVVGRGEGPLQELPRVVEPERIVVILDVVLRQQRVELTQSHCTSESWSASFTSISHQLNPSGSL